MMDRNVLIGMLRQGKTGDQLLQILEVITAETQNEVQTETEDEDIQFWVLNNQASMILAWFTSFLFSYFIMKTPQTVDDYILLLQAVKEKYGNLQVRRVFEENVNDSDDYYDFEDIMVASPPQSLLRDNDASESYLLFVY